jgi:hypothetical protein
VQGIAAKSVEYKSAIILAHSVGRVVGVSSACNYLDRRLLEVGHLTYQDAQRSPGVEQIKSLEAECRVDHMQTFNQSPGTDHSHV